MKQGAGQRGGVLGTLFSALGGLVRVVLKVALACVVSVFALVVVTNAIVIASTSENIVDDEEAGALAVDAIVVLGASVNDDGTPSDMLRARLDAAIELYFSGVASTIIMTGYDDGEYYDEVSVMRAYALEQGVADEAILCDPEGYSTYASMARLESVFGVESVIVVTQAFHLARAIYDGGGSDVAIYGLACDSAAYDDQLLLEVREVLARTKDFFVLLTGERASQVDEAIDAAMAQIAFLAKYE